jgi:hypothetical protein
VDKIPRSDQAGLAVLGEALLSPWTIRGRRVLIPGALLTGGYAAVALVSFGRAVPRLEHAWAHHPGRLGELTGVAGLPPGLLVALLVVVTVAAAWLGFGILAAALGAVGRAAGRPAPWGDWLTLALWANLPRLLALLLGMSLALVLGRSFPLPLTPALWTFAAAVGPLAYRILSGISPFTLWYGYVLAGGLIGRGLAPRRAVGWTLALWILGLGIDLAAWHLPLPRLWRLLPLGPLQPGF